MMKDIPELRVVTAQAGDENAVYEFMRQYFFHEEPLNASLKRNPSKEDFGPLKCIKDGWTLMAFAKGPDNEEQMAAVFISQVIRRDEPKAKSRKSDVKVLKILKLLADLDEKAEMWKRLTTDEIFYIICIAVRTEYRGMNISHRLVEESFKKARTYGLTHVTVECSSFYSARVMEKYGFEKIAEIRYEDYKDENGEVIFKTKKPHEAIVKYLKKL